MKVRNHKRRANFSNSKSKTCYLDLFINIVEFMKSAIFLRCYERKFGTVIRIIYWRVRQHVRIYGLSGISMGNLKCYLVYEVESIIQMNLCFSK